MAIYKKIYVGKDNIFKVVLTDSAGQPFKFLATGVTEIRLAIQNKVLSSLTANITYNDVGEIVFDLGSNSDIATLPRDINYICSILEIDPLHGNGQYLVHPDISGANLVIQIKD